jgi:hypothetical protein
MSKQDYVAMAEKVQLHDKLEQFTMGDLERIIGWVGDESIINDFKFWHFSFDGGTVPYPKLGMTIKVNTLEGINLILDEWINGNTCNDIAKGMFTNPESLRKAVKRAMKVARRRMMAISHQNQKVDEHWKRVIENFKVKEGK